MRGPAVEIDRIVRDVLAGLPAGAADGAARQRGAAVGNGSTARRSVPEIPLPKFAQDSGATRRVLITLSELDGRLDGRGELVVPRDALITPLARDHLKERGIRLKHVDVEEPATQAAASQGSSASVGDWAYAIVDAAALAQGAIQAVARNGTPLVPIAAGCLAEAIRECAEAVVLGRSRGAILFCDVPALAACAANKRPGVRAAVGESAQQVARVLRNLAANVLVIQPAGKTLHELRNLLRAFCSGGRYLQPTSDIIELLGEP